MWWLHNKSGSVSLNPSALSPGVKQRGLQAFIVLKEQADVLPGTACNEFIKLNTQGERYGIFR
jgi:hypothetical protein